MSIYKRFRSVDTPDRSNVGLVGQGAYALSPRFDQPTYLSFKLSFGEGGDLYYNNAGNVNFVLNYDRMPHPLFAPKGTDSVIDRERYSAIDYLLDANEFTRAKMMEEFIQTFNSLQTNYQWYFQKIDGVADLLKIDPKKGMRVTSDKRLTITALEGIDLRLTHLMNLYRKIAWDDTYQRWVLPDMMRYFTLNIYIAEFRTFHTPYPYTGYGYPVGNVGTELRLDILDDVLPVWQITCEMCEFDIENVEYDHLSSLGVDDVPNEAGVKFQIKVGKMYETQIYPTFINAYLIDRALNGFDRAKNEEGDGFYSKPFDSTSPDANNNRTIYNNKTKLAQAQNQTFNPIDKQHISGASYNQETNQKTLFGAKAAGPDGKLFTNDDNRVSVDPTNPTTWTSNLVDFGTAFIKNKVEQLVDKAKVTPIPGLGVSFNEAEAALQGKNIITALGLIRKGVNQVAREYVQPSELLEGNIVDNIFKSYLEGVTKSKATSDNEVALQNAATLALSDEGIWKQITDFSRATDLTAVNLGEVNEPNPIEGGTNYRNNVQDQTKGDLSAATNLVGKGETNVPKSISDDLDQGNVISTATTGSIKGETLEKADSIINNSISTGPIFEGAPSSQATTNKLQTG